ncbi:uncharacterized protein [Malus domestica]|uniref:uncharacterized protein isoform X5 n=1 Tax=Malus domestica TaxID=3750 RepID=UPI003975BC7D
MRDEEVSERNDRNKVKAFHCEFYNRCLAALLGNGVFQSLSFLVGVFSSCCVKKGLCVQQAKSFHSYELLGPLLPSQQLTYLGF